MSIVTSVDQPKRDEKRNTENSAISQRFEHGSSVAKLTALDDSPTRQEVEDTQAAKIPPKNRMSNAAVVFVSDGNLTIGGTRCRVMCCRCL